MSVCFSPASLLTFNSYSILFLDLYRCKFRVRASKQYQPSWLLVATTSRDGSGQETHVLGKAGSTTDGRRSRTFLQAKVPTYMLAVSTKTRIDQGETIGQTGARSSALLYPRNMPSTRSTPCSALAEKAKCTTFEAASTEIGTTATRACGAT